MDQKEKIQKNWEKLPKEPQEGELKSFPEIPTPEMPPSEEAQEESAAGAQEPRATTEGETAQTQEAREREKPELLEHIEGLLSENLEELYLALPAETKIKFKTEGEKISQEIIRIMYNAKLHEEDRFQKVHDTIREWLFILSQSLQNLNEFFIENEAKIKTEKIIRLLMNASAPQGET